nr:hypothetical protein [Tanacetum cinerariifolium]
MATTIDQQVALNESLVPSTQRLRIGRSNFRLPCDIQSKESTLQVVYDATAKLHHNSIRFKIDTKKSVLDLEAFTKMLHISPRIPSQSFAELPSEEEILDFLRQETYISQQRGFGTYEGTCSKPRVPDVPSDDSEEELSWNSSDDEEVGEQTKEREKSEGDKSDESNDECDDDTDETVKAGSERDKDDDDNDDEEELAKKDDEDTKSSKGGDEVSESEGESDKEETRQEEDESFDPLSEEARIQEEEEADELYRDVNINQGRGLHVTQNIEDSHVTLTPVQPDGLQESSSVSSFVTSMLNSISNAEVEFIFTTASSPIVSLQTPTPIMTPFTIATITTSSDAPIPPTLIP